MAQRISLQDLPDFGQLPDSSMGFQVAGAGKNLLQKLEPLGLALDPFVVHTEFWEDTNLNGITDGVTMHLPEGPNQHNMSVIDDMLCLPLPYQTDQQGNQDISGAFSMHLPYVPFPLITNGTTGSLPGSQVFTQHSINLQPLRRSMFQCNNCMATFTRDADRIRHENTKHRMVPGAHVCPVTACPKSQGVGYSRPDKLKEHLWKQHANLGYTKRT